MIMLKSKLKTGRKWNEVTANEIKIENQIKTELHGRAGINQRKAGEDANE